MEHLTKTPLLSVFQGAGVTNSDSKSKERHNSTKGPQMGKKQQGSKNTIKLMLEAKAAKDSKIKKDDSDAQENNVAESLEVYIGFKG